MDIKTYRKKPVEVQGLLFDGSNHQEVSDFVGVADTRDHAPGWDKARCRVFNSSQHAWNDVNEGDTILRGLVGEFYPCSPDALAVTYDEVSE
jgi:hypothetical protein